MTKSFSSIKFGDSYALHFVFLFGTVLLFFTKHLPFDNEYIYLLRLATTYNKDLLLNDLSFSVPASEHWLFNHLFGLLTYFFSIEMIGWVGRIVCWTVLLAGFMRLAKCWEIPRWMATSSIFLWLCCGQSIIGQEWIFGSFEAKCIAYICLIFALDGFSRDKNIYPAILLGLTFSFHPAVGLWGGLASAGALLVTSRRLPELIRIGLLATVFALPGLLPLLSEVTKIASVEDWKFLEVVRLPDLFDPFSWSKTAICLIYLQLVFCILFYFSKAGGERRKFLVAFLTGLGLFFTIGLVLRLFEQYALLRYMPMRLFPIFAPIFFLLTFSEVFEKKLFGPPLKALGAIGFLSILLLPNPFSTAIDQIAQTYRSLHSESDDTAKCFIWLRGNTPNGTIAIAPPYRKDFWYLSDRAQVVSSGFPTYVDLREWRERIELLTGESLASRNNRETDERPRFYNSRSKEQVDEIAARTDASYLISEGDYPYPVVFVSGKSKLYLVKPDPGQSK